MNLSKEQKDNKLKIFISSPEKDLMGERDAIIDLLSKHKELEPIAMELFMSSPDMPKKECLNQLKDADAVILLIGPYYGSIDPETGISFTELEYDEATDLGLDVFPFVKIKEGKTEWEPDDEKDELKEKHRKYFGKIFQTYKKFYNSSELKKYIIPSLERYEKERKRKYLPLVDYHEYFSLFIGQDKILRHDYALSGREKELKQLEDFAVSEQKICVVYGIGGIGKSKILYEFAKIHENKKLKGRLLFLKERFDNETLKQIPSGDVTIILEDAHRYEYLDNLLSIFRNSDLSNRSSLILSSRPTGKEILDVSLSRAIDATKVSEIKIESLDIKETKEIIKSIVGNNKVYIDYISNISKDCPLIAVIASSLVRENKINLSTIQNNEVFQRTVLNRFLEDMKGRELSDPLSENLLMYIAALSPIRPADKSLQIKLANILGIKDFELSKRISLLEKKGILLRRGRLVRIVPDLLSDHILYEACISADGASTGFADEVFDKFHEIHFENILKNIAEVEWRTQAAGSKIDLLDNVWKDIIKSFREGPNYVRIQILKEIEKASIFQPEHVMEIIEIAISQPSTLEPYGENADILASWSQKDVLAKLPDIIRRVAYHLEYVKKCCRILWEISKNDLRELNPHPEHPIRILTSIASYQYNKPVSFNYQVLEWIEEEIQKPENHKYKYSLLDVLDKFLAKEGEYTETEGDKFILGSFPLNHEKIYLIRQRTIKILNESFKISSPANLILRSLRSLLDALRYIMPKFGMVVTEEENRQWLKEQVQILDIIKENMLTINSFPIYLEIIKGLQWFRAERNPEAIKEKVKEIYSLIYEDYEFKLYRVMSYNFMDYRREERKSFEENNKLISKEMKEVAQLVKDKERTWENIHLKFRLIIKEFMKYNISINPSRFFAEFTELFPDISVGIAGEIINNPKEDIVKYLSSFLWPLKKIKYYSDVLKELLSSGVKTKDYLICLNIAHAYAWANLLDDFDQYDLENIESLIKLKNEEITITISRAVAVIGEKNVDIARRLLLLFDLNNNLKLANEFCGMFGDIHGISLKKLAKKDIEAILDKLIPADLFTAQDYHSDKILEFVSQNYLDLAIEFLIKRLKHYDLIRNKDKTYNYRPFPYSGFNYAFLGIAKLPNYGKYIKEVRNLVMGKDPKDLFWIPRLFQIVSDNYSQESLLILKEWLTEKDSQKMEGIAILLKEAPNNFLFDNYEFIGNLLLSAERISRDCLKKVESELFSIAISGVLSRSIGQPDKEDIILINKGKETANKFNISHPANKFYLDVSKHSDREIKEDIDRDEEFLDE